jgi:ABC-type ATPase with predicted acetyltransferase domain
MGEYNVSKAFPWVSQRTPAVISLMKMFGIDAARLRTDPVWHKCKLKLLPGDVCFITGPSGSGKSVIFSELFNSTEGKGRIDLDDIEIDSGRSVIDCMDVEVLDGMRNLSYAGISDVLSALNSPACLSMGQQYRYKLARALSSGRKIIFADEFCSNLDRVTACVIAYQIRKFARRTGTTFILASSHDDVIADLATDVVVSNRLVGETEIVYRKASRQREHERQANVK